MRTTFLLIITLCAFLSCGESPKTEQVSTNKIEVVDGWARPGKAGMMSSAYFTIKNGTSEPDSLLSVTSSISSDAQIHESYATEDGLMGMRPQGLVPIPANSDVQFKQGGLHVMIIQPNLDLAEGDSVTLTLSFSSLLELNIKLPVKPTN